MALQSMWSILSARMRKLPECLFLLTVALVCGVYAVPFGNYEIEGRLDPDHVGGIISLGSVPAHWIRFAVLLAWALPLSLGAGFVAFSERFQKPQRYWGHAALILLFGILILCGAGTLETFR